MTARQLVRSITTAVAILLFDSCLERVTIPIPESFSKDLIVDGLITNEPGPYTVKLSQAIKIDDTRPLGVPLYAKSVTIHDDAGNSEVLEDKEYGVYQTKPNGIRGEIGRSYHITIELQNGQAFNSEPDKMSAVGHVDSIYYQFVTHQLGDSRPTYGYRVFINAYNLAGSDNYTRWRFSGTYIAETKPAYKICDFGCGYCPPPCAHTFFINGNPQEGYQFNPATNQYEYVPGLRCECCRCWVTMFEDKPIVSDNQVVVAGRFSAVEVGYVPVTYYTFMEKFRIEVRQMSLSRQAFNYWKTIQAQQEGKGSLFQPVIGSIPTNVSEDGDERGLIGVRGIFYAAAVSTKYRYITKLELPRVDIKVPEDCYLPPRKGAVGESCLLAFPGSATSTSPPADWEN